MAGDKPSVAFSLGAKRPTANRPSLRDADDDKRQRRELVTGLSADGGMMLAQPPADDPKGPRVIAKQDDTFQSGRGKRVPGFLPTAAAADELDGAADKFETAAPEEHQRVQYGLQHMQPRPTDGMTNGHVASARDAREADAERLKAELQELPPDPDEEAYDRMPVEEFGLALLRGMGWEEGKGVGRKGEVVKPVEYVRRPERLGLGAAPALPKASDKKYIKPGETREPKKDMVYMDADGTAKHVKTIDDKLVERPKEGVHPGKTMHVVDGKHTGCTCIVVSLEPPREGRSDRASIRLLPSEQVVTVRCKELSDERAPAKADRIKDSSDGRDRRKDDRKGSHKHASTSGRGVAALDDRPPVRPWLLPHIRVRVIDKDLKHGKLYLKKGVVLDVSQPTVCDVHLDDTRETLSDVHQSQLETVVPKREGSRVMVVCGPLRHKVAKLLQKNNETGLAAVQLLEELSIEKLSLDDIAEYIGDDP